MISRRKLLLSLAAIALLAVGFWLHGWYGSGPLDKQTAFVVPDGSTLTSVAAKLEKEGAIGSASSFLTRAKILGSGDPIKAGEFLLPAGSSPATIDRKSTRLNSSH